MTPVIFMGVGLPGVAPATEKVAELRAWGQGLAAPRGVVVVSGAVRSPTPARGAATGSASAAVAADLAEVLRLGEGTAPGIPPAHEVLLGHFFGKKVPAVQLAIPETTPKRLFALGRSLGPLSARGIMIVALGAMVYAPDAADRATLDAAPPSWAQEFDAWCANLLSDQEITELFAFRAQGPHAAMSHPTPEGIDALFVAAGAASLREHAVGFPIRGFEHGTVSRRCVQFGRST